MNKIRVMIVDDSLMFREFLSRALAKDSHLDIVGAFADPIQALEQIPALKPDVITLDMEMPKMRGDEFLRIVLPRYPDLNIVVISSLSSNVFDAMHAGALDFVGKPGLGPGQEREQFIKEVIQKIKIAGSARTKRSVGHTLAAVAAAAQQKVMKMSGQKADLSGVNTRSIIAIGASTGGTEAILEVIRDFPASTPGVVIVQHMPPVFTRMYAERLDKLMAMHVREAKHGDRVERGTVLIAPGGDQQMRIKSDAQGYSISLNTGPKVSGHCPSVDVLFESVADAAGPHAVGVILTGMGSDGARALLKMRDKGAFTIGQDQDSSVVYGMPRVAYDLGAVVEQWPLESIGAAVLRHFGL